MYWSIKIDELLQKRSDEMNDYVHVYMNDDDYLEFLNEALVSWEKETNLNVRYIHRLLSAPYTVRAIGTIDKDKIIALNIELPYGTKLN